MPLCPGCGSNETGTAPFCYRCGSAMTAPADTTAGGVGGSEADAVEEPATKEPSKRGRRRTYLAAGSILLAVALLGTGVSVGWVVASDRNLVEAQDLPDTEPGPTAVLVENVMPDLRGLELDAGLQILADLGVAAATISQEAQPAAGEVGVVLAQTPVMGTPVEDDVVLTVSAEARVPPVKGREAVAVLSELEQLGAQVRSVSRYVPGAEVGEIASITPAPGSRLSDEIVVVIATAPTELDLVELESVDYGCDSSSGSLNGTTFDSLLTCSAGPEAIEHTYLINRGGSIVRGVFGIPDDSDTGEGYSSDMHLDVLADGEIVGSWDVLYGSTTPVRADVQDALRITLRVRSNNDDYGTGALGNLILEGDPGRLDPLVQEQ